MLTLPEQIVFALLLIGFIGYVVLRTRTLVRLLQLCAPDPDERKPAIGAVVVDVLSQRATFRKPWVGLFHILIVWGFLIFAVNTINHFTAAFVPGFHLFGDTPAAAAYAAVADVFAVLIIAGVLGLAIRRYVLRPAVLTPRSIESAIVFIGIGGAMLAYLFANATEIAIGAAAETSAHIVAAPLAGVFRGLSPGALLVTGHIAWWLDALFHLMLVALLVIPTKHMHLIAGPINLAFKRTRPRGTLRKMDLEDEDAEQFGVEHIEQFSWKQNLDLYACIECGRCQDYCPTWLTGKPLKPKYLITDLKDHLLEDGPKLLKQENGERPTTKQLIGTVADVEAIWACTTCMACVEHCPMGIEHVDKLVDMRRHLTLMESATPEQAQNTFRQMENAGNPWGLPREERAKWAEGLDVPLMADKLEVDILWWVGCAGSYDDRNTKVSRAMAQILNAAGADFAILGPEERCNCESARRLGNEYLYQMAAAEIVETLNQYKFNRILTACPHCFNTIKNEYPGFGGRYEVIHHSQFICELMADGKLPVSRGNDARTVFHDSCYIGRYNDVYEEPRRAIAATGAEAVEAERNRVHGLCCGAGGGRMWLEETLGEPINAIRADELLRTGAQEIGASCPFCITMLSDSVTNCASDVPVRDIAEIVAERLG
ncbi:MAG: (Fe-S)-binding protein [Candidatus Hydrogenedentota bacterium]